MKGKMVSSFLTVSLIFSTLAPLPLHASNLQTTTFDYLQKQSTENPWVIEGLRAFEQVVSPDAIPQPNKLVATDLERVILGVVAGGGNPYAFNGQNLVEQLDGLNYQHQIGSEELLNDDIFGILAYIAIGAWSNDGRVRDSRDYLLAHQNNDGGWSYSVSANNRSDSNLTAMAIQALIQAELPANDKAIARALNFLKACQNMDGGFGAVTGAESDSASTSWIISGLQYAGIDPATWVMGGHTPWDYLDTLKLENGGYKWKASDRDANPTMTAYVAIAQAGIGYPVAVFGAANKKPLLVMNEKAEPLPQGLIEDLQDQAEEMSQPTQPAAEVKVSPDPKTDGDAFSHQVAVQVRYRIEGKDRQICQGSASAKNEIDLLKKTSEVCGFDYQFFGDKNGYHISSLGGDRAGLNATGPYWIPIVNWNGLNHFRGDSQLKKNDYVTWYYGTYEDFSLKISITNNDSVDAAKTDLLVESYNPKTATWSGSSGATIFINGKDYSVDEKGRLTVNFDPGVYTMFAEKPGHVRSAVISKVVRTPKQKSASISSTVVISEKAQVQESDAISFDFILPSSNQSGVLFGDVQPGETHTQSITLKNTSRYPLRFSFDASGGFYENYLKANNGSLKDFYIALQPNEEKSVNFTLSVPKNYTVAGKKDSDLFVWAIPLL